MNHRLLLTSFLVVLCLAMLAACGGDDDDSDATPTAAASATPSPTPLQPDPAAAQGVYDSFVAAVNGGDISTAWALYAASVPGTTSEHLSDQGCSFDAFTVEFPRMQNMFARTSPTVTTGTFSDAPNSPVVEFTMTGADGQEFLVTLVRVQPHEAYRIKWMNNGQVLDNENGTPAPLPSPNDPQGICGIWTSGR